MTALERVQSTRRILGVAAVTQAIVWGITAALGIVAINAFGSLAFPGLRDDSVVTGFAPLIEGVTVTGLMLWRRRRFASIDRVALWIEERIPDLRYSLVTAMEQRGSPFADEMERAVARHDIHGVTLTALRRRTLKAVAALIVTVLIL